MNLERRKEIEDFLIDCCSCSSILYDDKYRSIKYLVGFGKVVYIEQSRMLDLVERTIPNYCKETDEIIISDIFSNSERLKCCESHDFYDYHYVYSMMLI